MPYTHKILHEEQLAIVKGSGKVTLADSLGAIEKISTIDDFLPTYNIVVDLRDIIYSPSVSDAYAIANMLGGLKDDYQGKVALLASSKFHYGMIRMLSTFADLKGFSQIAPFWNLEDAQQWLKTTV